MNDTVLVVDDDQLLLRLLEINLSKVGCQVLKALDGPTALRIASEEIPSLILLDLMMPRMNGWEVIRQLKDCESTRDIPVIIVTGKVDHETRSRVMEMGAADFVTKPFDVIELRKMIKDRLAVHS